MKSALNLLLLATLVVIPGCDVVDFSQSDFEPPSGRHYIQDGSQPMGGPATHRLLLANSDDGVNFEKLNMLLTDQADVPDIVVDDDGKIYIYYVGNSVGQINNTLAAAISNDNGSSWIYKKVELNGLNADMADPVDPSVLILDDGTFRLYFTTQNPAISDYAFTHYADSKDGFNFEYKGESFDPGGKVLDPSVIKIGDTFHIFGGGASAGKNWHGISRDGQYFEFYGYESPYFGDQPFIMSNGLEVPGGYRYFGFNPDGDYIASLFTVDGYNWEVEDGHRLDFDSSSSLEYGDIKDSSTAKLADGTFLMVYVTEIPQ